MQLRKKIFYPAKAYAKDLTTTLYLQPFFLDICEVNYNITSESGIPELGTPESGTPESGTPESGAPE